jgi:hypothetical protein
VFAQCYHVQQRNPLAPAAWHLRASARRLSSPNAAAVGVKARNAVQQFARRFACQPSKPARLAAANAATATAASGPLSRTLVPVLHTRANLDRPARVQTSDSRVELVPGAWLAALARHASGTSVRIGAPVRLSVAGGLRVLEQGQRAVFPARLWERLVKLRRRSALASNAQMGGSEGQIVRGEGLVVYEFCMMLAVLQLQRDKSCCRVFELQQPNPVWDDCDQRPRFARQPSLHTSTCNTIHDHNEPLSALTACVAFLQTLWLRPGLRAGAQSRLCCTQRCNRQRTGNSVWLRLFCGTYKDPAVWGLEVLEAACCVGFRGTQRSLLRGM